MKKSRLKDYVAGILIGASSILSQPTHTAVAQETKQEQSIDDLTQSEVDSLMLRESVEDILKEEYSSGRIQRITYDSSTGKTNFRELVYQDNISKEHKKPVLMLVADGDGQGWFDKSTYDFAKGNAVVLKATMRKNKNFKYVLYDPSIDPDYFETGENKARFGKELRDEELHISPSIFLFSLFDLTKQETETKNDEQIKKLDIIRGGVKKNSIFKLNRDINTYWLQTNITTPNDHYLWRTQNSEGIKWIKISYTCVAQK